MKPGTLTTLTLIATMSAALPAVAGQPDTPGEKGQLVNERKDVWQDRRGQNGWGSRVSEIAKSNKGNADTNLGSYLSDETSGPAAESDSGSGND